MPSAAPVPYNPANLRPPLTGVQKTAMLAFMVGSGYASRADIETTISDTAGANTSLAGYVSGTSGPPLAAKVDPEFINLYKDATLGGHLNANPQTSKELNVPGISSVTDFLKLLTSGNLWIRVGEFAVGAILIAVGVNGMLKQQYGSRAPQVRVGAVANKLKPRKS